MDVKLCAASDVTGDAGMGVIRAEGRTMSESKRVRCEWGVEWRRSLGDIFDRRLMGEVAVVVTEGKGRGEGGNGMAGGPLSSGGGILVFKDGPRNGSDGEGGVWNGFAFKKSCWCCSIKLRRFLPTSVGC